MKEQLLKTEDARFTPAWIWGMSDMRALTAAIVEKEVFQPTNVLVTGGSKRGVGAAAAGIHDERFAAILPVVAPWRKISPTWWTWPPSSPSSDRSTPPRL